MLEPCDVTESAKNGYRSLSGEFSARRCSGMMGVDPTVLTGRMATAWRTVVWYGGWDISQPENNPGFLRAFLGSSL